MGHALRKPAPWLGSPIDWRGPHGTWTVGSVDTDMANQHPVMCSLIVALYTDILTWLWTRVRSGPKSNFWLVYYIWAPVP